MESLKNRVSGIDQETEKPEVKLGFRQVRKQISRQEYLTWAEQKKYETADPLGFLRRKQGELTKMFHWNYENTKTKQTKKIR